LSAASFRIRYSGKFQKTECCGDPFPFLKPDPDGFHTAA